MRYIVDDIGTVVNATSNNMEWAREFEEAFRGAPFYLYGHRLEINNRLKLKDKDREKKKEKFPLIALRMDIPEDVGNTVVKYTLNIIIVTSTERNYTAEDRYNKVFKPVLYPIYEKFIEQLYNSGLFTWDGGGETPPHTKIDRPFWGNVLPDKNDALIFDYTLDAIEILNLKLNSTKNC